MAHFVTLSWWALVSMSSLGRVSESGWLVWPWTPPMFGSVDSANSHTRGEFREPRPHPHLVVSVETREPFSLCFAVAFPWQLARLNSLPCVFAI